MYWWRTPSHNTVHTKRGSYGNRKKIYDKNTDNFLFFNKMKSPVKKINNKYRYQALMRLTGDYQKIKDEIYEKSLEKKTSKVLVYVEENPSNLY